MSTNNGMTAEGVGVLAVMDGARECLRTGPIGYVSIGRSLCEARDTVALTLESLKEALSYIDWVHHGSANGASPVFDKARARTALKLAMGDEG